MSDLGVTKKYDRSLYDSDINKKEFKADFFDGSKEKTDEITGERLHISHSAAKNKYHRDSGSKAWTKHAAETDHIAALEDIHSRVTKSPLGAFLSDEDLKRIANSDYNYRVVSKSFNASKQEKSDFIMAMDSEQNLTIKGRLNLAAQKTKAEVCLGAEIAKTATVNMAGEFAGGAVQAVGNSAIQLGFEGLNQINEVMSGNKSVGEAAEDMARLTITIGVSGGTRRLAADVIQYTAESSGNKLIASVLSGGKADAVIAAAIIVTDTAIKLSEGDITGEELVCNIALSVGRQAVIVLCPELYFAAEAGKAVINSIKQLHAAYQSVDTLSKKASMVRNIEKQAISDMEAQRGKMVEIFGREQEQWHIAVDGGFSAILNATLNNDAEGVALGLNKILNHFGECVAFESREDFDRFFDDETAVLDF